MSDTFPCKSPCEHSCTAGQKNHRKCLKQFQKKLIILKTFELFVVKCTTENIYLALSIWIVEYPTSLFKGQRTPFPILDAFEYTI